MPPSSSSPAPFSLHVCVSSCNCDNKPRAMGKTAPKIGLSRPRIGLFLTAHQFLTSDWGQAPSLAPFGERPQKGAGPAPMLSAEKISEKAKNAGKQNRRRELGHRRARTERARIRVRLADGGGGGNLSNKGKCACFRAFIYRLRRNSAFVLTLSSLSSVCSVSQSVSEFNPHPDNFPLLHEFQNLPPRPCPLTISTLFPLLFPI